MRILLPAYNEERALPALLPKIAAAMHQHGVRFHLTVLDDGSDDRTAEVLAASAAELPLEVISHSLNRGLGETVRDLFEHASSVAGPDDVIVRMDCDDTHGPEVIPQMIRALDSGPDVVIASRFQAGGGQQGVSRYRTFVSWCANLYMKLIFPISGVRDYTCGFRAYRAPVIKRAIEAYGNDFVQLKGLGFTCTLEKLIKLDLLGARICEVPFELRYDQKQGDSKMVMSITTLGYLVMAVLYHWPWGGWRVEARRRARQRDRS